MMMDMALLSAPFIIDGSGHCDISMKLWNQIEPHCVAAAWQMVVDYDRPTPSYRQLRWEEAIRAARMLAVVVWLSDMEGPDAIIQFRENLRAQLHRDPQLRGRRRFSSLRAEGVTLNLIQKHLDQDFGA